MAEKEKDVEKKESVSQPEKQVDTQPTQIRWDGSKMKSAYANVCNVSSTREEVTLLFGTNQSWYAGQKELSVELTDRIILNPFAAKRLSVLLNNVVREYEARFGEIAIEIPGRATDKKT